MENLLIYGIGIFISLIAIYLLGILVAPYSPDNIKTTHFECGLPESSSQPKRANFEFFLYAIMFIVADMTGLFFTLFVFNNHSYFVAMLFATIMALALIISMMEYKNEDI